MPCRWFCTQCMYWPVRRKATTASVPMQRWMLRRRCMRNLTFDMRGGRNAAKLHCGRPLDGRVRFHCARLTWGSEVCTVEVQMIRANDGNCLLDVRECASECFDLGNCRLLHGATLDVDDAAL